MSRPIKVGRQMADQQGFELMTMSIMIETLKKPWTTPRSLNPQLNSFLSIEREHR